MPLVQPVDGVEHEVRAPGPGQGPRHGGGVRQEVGGVGRHPGGLVHHQQVAVLPDDGQGPVAGGGGHLRRAVVAGLHLQDVPGVEDVHRAGVMPVDQDAVLRPGQPGDGVGREVQPRPQDVADGGAVLLRRDDFGDGFQRPGPLSGIRIAQKAAFEQGRFCRA